MMTAIDVGSFRRGDMVEEAAEEGLLDARE